MFYKNKRIYQQEGMWTFDGGLRRFSSLDEAKSYIDRLSFVAGVVKAPGFHRSVVYERMSLPEKFVNNFIEETSKK